MAKQLDASNAVDFNNDDSNTSANPTFDSIFNSRMSRRNMLRSSAGLAVTAAIPSFGLAGCGSDDVAAPPAERLLSFTAVAKSLADRVSVPVGYSATVLYALGDPLFATTTTFKNDGTDADFENRAGDHHDGMEWLGMTM